MNRVEDAATPCLRNQRAGFSAADVADHVDVVNSDRPEPEAGVVDGFTIPKSWLGTKLTDLK